MHTEIKYEGSQREKDDAAIEDIIEWLGADRFWAITQALGEQAETVGLSYKQMGLYAGLAGIGGYPTDAWFRYIADTIHSYSNSN